MTTKDIAAVARVSARTVTRTAKENGIGVIKPGVETVFTELESVQLMAELRKKGFVEPRQNVQQPRQNDELVTKSDLVAFGSAIVSEMMKQFIPLIQSQTKQIDFKQDYFSIKGYASKLGQQIAFSEALSLGRIASKISRERMIEIRKIEDEAFGSVNSYHISVLEEIFQI
jgi:hypothetical protein